MGVIVRSIYLGTLEAEAGNDATPELNAFHLQVRFFIVGIALARLAIVSNTSC